MSDILQLERFFTVKMHVEVVSPDEPPDEGQKLSDHSFNVDYRVYRKPDDPDRYMMSLLLSIEPKTYGWKVNAQLDGFFKCPEGLTPSMREGVVRINGGTILYGLLRGQLSAMTGSFFGGPVILPTVNMMEIVKTKEEKAGNTVIESTDDENENSE